MRQVGSGWADGPAYITQCPIGAGNAYTYNFTVLDQRGTLWWHAHFSWQRASVYGAFIIHPTINHNYNSPFSFSLPPYIPLIFGTYLSLSFSLHFFFVAFWVLLPLLLYIIACPSFFVHEKFVSVIYVCVLFLSHCPQPQDPIT